MCIFSWVCRTLSRSISGCPDWETLQPVKEKASQSYVGLQGAEMLLTAVTANGQSVSNMHICRSCYNQHCAANFTFCYNVVFIVKENPNYRVELQAIQLCLFIKVLIVNGHHVAQESIRKVERFSGIKLVSDL